MALPNAVWGEAPAGVLDQSLQAKAEFKLDVSGNATGLVAPDGTEYEIVNDLSELVPESTPATAAAAGVEGAITRDASYIYVCTATNTWKRAAIATW